MDVQKSSLLKLEQIEDGIANYCSKEGLTTKTTAYLLQSNSMCLCFFLLQLVMLCVLQWFKVFIFF